MKDDFNNFKTNKILIDKITQNQTSKTGKIKEEAQIKANNEKEMMAKIQEINTKNSNKNFITKNSNNYKNNNSSIMVNKEENEKEKEASSKIQSSQKVTNSIFKNSSQYSLNDSFKMFEKALNINKQTNKPNSFTLCSNPMPSISSGLNNKKENNSSSELNLLANLNENLNSFYNIYLQNNGSDVFQSNNFLLNGNSTKSYEIPNNTSNINNPFDFSLANLITACSNEESIKILNNSVKQNNLFNSSQQVNQVNPNFISSNFQAQQQVKQSNLIKPKPTNNMNNQIHDEVDFKNLLEVNSNSISNNNLGNTSGNGKRINSFTVYKGERQKSMSNTHKTTVSNQTTSLNRVSLPDSAYEEYFTQQNSDSDSESKKSISRFNKNQVINENEANKNKDKKATNNPAQNELNKLKLKEEVKDDYTESNFENYNEKSIKTPYKFIAKLLEILSDNRFFDIISWSNNGKVVEIKSSQRFVNEVLSHHFKHSNFSNFVRQLNMYNFKKLRHYHIPKIMAYENQYFIRGREELIHEITRRSQNNPFYNINVGHSPQTQTVNKTDNPPTTSYNNNHSNLKTNLSNLNNLCHSPVINPSPQSNNNTIPLKNEDQPKFKVLKKNEKKEIKEEERQQELIEDEQEEYKRNFLIKKINFLVNKIILIEKKVITVENTNQRLLFNNLKFLEQIKNKDYYINMLEGLVFFIVNNIFYNSGGAKKNQDLLQIKSVTPIPSSSAQALPMPVKTNSGVVEEGQAKNEVIEKKEE